MNIRQSLLIYAFLVVIGMVAILGYSSKLMMENNVQAEKQQMLSEVLRFQAVIERQQLDLGALMADWAGWDDPYEYVTNRDDEFIENNVDPEMMKTANLTFMAFLDNSGSLFFSRLIDPQTAEEIPLSESLRQVLVNSDKSLVFNKNTDSKLGLVWDGKSTLMIGAYPIIGNSRQRPINGTLVMGRAVRTSKVDLGNGNFLTQTLMSMSEQLIDGSETKVVTSESSVAAYRAMDDMSGRPTLLMKIEQPRTMVQQGNKIAFSYAGVLLVLTGLFAFFLIIVAERIISRPLITLRNELRGLVEAKAFEKRIGVHGLREQRDVSIGINLLMEMNQQLAKDTLAGTEKMKEQLVQIEAKNEEMEQTKSAMMNILEDERELEEQLKKEKTSIEEKVVERTRDLELEQAKLRGSIENLPVGFMMVDQQGTVAMTNRVIKEIFEDQEAASVFTLITTWIKNQKDVTLDGSVSLPTSLSAFNDLQYNSKYLNISVAPMTIPGDKMLSVRIGWVILVSDVTEAKMVQKSRDEFFSIASHELRTPLTAIRGNMALIRDYYPEVMKDESLAPIITDVHTASLRLIQIVNDFLDASRLELNKIQFKLEPFDVMTIVKKVTDTGKIMAKEKGIECVLTMENDQPLMVLADQARTEQVLYNLVGNAIKFTKEGGITIDVTSGEDNRVHIRVIDTGAGIPVENHGLLFRKFQQAGTSVFTREASEGSGMGLYISSLLAQGMHGAIKLESSELGKGSVFVFELLKT